MFRMRLVSSLAQNFNVNPPRHYVCLPRSFTESSKPGTYKIVGLVQGSKVAYSIFV